MTGGEGTSHYEPVDAPPDAVARAVQEWVDEPTRGYSGDGSSTEYGYNVAVAEVKAMLREAYEVRSIEEDRYSGMIAVVRGATERGLVVHLATRATCTEHIESGDDSTATPEEPTP